MMAAKYEMVQADLRGPQIRNWCHFAEPAASAEQGQERQRRRLVLLEIPSLYPSPKMAFAVNATVLPALILLKRSAKYSGIATSTTVHRPSHQGDP